MRGAFSAATAIRSPPPAPIRNGRAAIEWGVYGVPETFIVGRDGRIAYKLVGPITPDNLDTRDQAGDREGAGGGVVVSRHSGSAAKRAQSGIHNHRSAQYLH